MKSGHPVSCLLPIQLSSDMSVQGIKAKYPKYRMSSSLQLPSGVLLLLTWLEMVPVARHILKFWEKHPVLLPPTQLETVKKCQKCPVLLPLTRLETFLTSHQKYLETVPTSCEKHPVLLPQTQLDIGGTPRQKRLVSLPLTPPGNSPKAFKSGLWAVSTICH